MKHRWLIVLCCLALMALHLIWYGWPTALFGMIPIAMLLPGLWTRRTLAIAFTGFVGLGYLAHGLTEFTATPTDRVFAVTELVLALGMLAFSSVWLKQIGQMRKTNG